MFIFLDESGCLGFDFDKVGTSSHFTITLLFVENVHFKDVNNAVRRTLRNKINARRSINIAELKATQTNLQVKKYFYNKMPETGWKLYSITVNKHRVFKNLTDKNGKGKLYNFLVKELLNKIQPNDFGDNQINFIIDKSKNKSERKDFDNYIRAHLETKLPIDRNIFITHENSAQNAGLQAADMFCYGFQRSRSVGDEYWRNVFVKHISVDFDYLK